MDEEEEGLHEVSIMKTFKNQDFRHLPCQYQIEIQGVCVVTENLIKETLAMKITGTPATGSCFTLAVKAILINHTARGNSLFFQLAAGARSSFW